MKCGRAVAQTKRHGKIFIEAKRSNDCCFGNIMRMERNLVVDFHKIQREENGRTVKTDEKILEIREWIAVRRQVGAIGDQIWGEKGIGGRFFAN